MGALYCVASAVAFGVMAVFAKQAYADGVSVDVLLLARFGMAGIVLVLLAHRADALRRLERRSVVAALLMGAVGYAAQAGFYFAALTRTGASQVALVFCVYPLLVMVAATAIGRDRPSVRRAVALGVALVGVALVLGRGATGSFDALGAGLALSAALVYTVYILVGDRVVRDVPPLPLTALVCVGGATTFLLLSLLRGGPDLGFDPHAWIWLVLLSLVGTVGGIILFFAGVAKVGPSVASLLSIVEPVVTVGSAALVFGEQLSLAQGLGGALVLTAVLVVQWPSRAVVLPLPDLDVDLELQPEVA